MNADAAAIIEQALRHVLDEQAKLLKRSDSALLHNVILELNKLAVETQKAIAEGVDRIKSVKSLIRFAKRIEASCDRISQRQWSYIPVAVSSVYENLERALQPPLDKYGASAELRSHYQNLRVRLLQQALGARMLDSNSDLGDENERIWQQFLQRSLGASVRVVRGGVVCDYQGNCSNPTFARLR